MSTMTDLPNSAVVLAAGYGGEWDDNGGSSVLQFECAGADRNRFLQVVAGLPQTFTYGNTTATRIVPLKHPDNYNQYAVGIREFVPEDSAGFPTPGGGIMFDVHRFDVRFATPTFSYDGSDPMITIERGVSSEMVTRPGRAYRMPSDNLYIPHNVGAKVQIVRYAATFHRLPALNNAAFDQLAGSVNSQPFYLAGNQIAAGHVLYNGCSSTGQLTLGGSASFEATHEFEYRSIPHNQIMRPDGSAGPDGTGFEAPVGPDGSYILPTADLNQLYGA